ncbi:MAG: CHAT domain-containing protein [Cyanobacteria bacterium J06643_13]
MPANASYRFTSVQSDPARQLLEEGIELYETEFFDDARKLWARSASLYARQGDFLGRALALNNLALAYQNLGQWSESGTTIAKSLKLLNSASLKQQPGYEEILAKALNTKGNWEWTTGSVEQAAATWKQALEYYDRSANAAGIIKTKINQGKALQALGSNLQAVKLLETLFEDLQQQPNLELKALGLRYLGDALRNIGKLERSEQILLESIEFSPDNNSLGLAWLELGNTQRELGDRFTVQGKKTEAADYLDRAMQSYQTAEQLASPRVLLRINLNQLSLLVESGQYDRAEAFLAQKDLQPQLEQTPSRTNIYARLNYAQSLTCLQWQAKTVPVCQQRAQPNTENSYSYQTEIIAILYSAIAMAHSLNDTTVKAQAIGQLAQVYELQHNFTDAKKSNQQALLLLENRQAPDLVYTLAWQLGRIFKQQQQPETAILAYQQAISALETVRGNILYIDPQVQFDFRDRIEPVYREYADLLLTTQNSTAPSQENLRQAIRAIDALQLAELENYLGCKLSQLVQLDETAIDYSAAKIYPIVLADRLAIVTEIPGQPLNFQETKISSSEVQATLVALQNNLSQPGKTPEVLRSAQKIYRWLISPLESFLAASEIKTLVFVPDNLLRNIPLSVLYDGQQYLLEKQYALAVSPQLELFAPATSNAPLQVLIGGVEIPQTVEGIRFPKIEQVQQELVQISQMVNTNNPLLNEEFTKVNIEQKLRTGDFSAIHWKTHGIFSSNPAETFLVAYQDSIKANELQTLIRTASKDGLEPIELLVLSACETAKGDNRAVLGLAGFTVRAGARTALSTLWRADDRATTLLMTEFYQQLSQPGITKAEALHQAQLSLIEREGYFAPYYWGTYVLVGSWI